MTGKDWIKVIETMPQDKVKRVHDALEILVQWPEFKREFVGVQTLKSLVNCNLIYRRAKLRDWIKNQEGVT